MNLLKPNKQSNFNIRFGRTHRDWSTVDFRTESKMFNELDNKIEKELFIKKVLGLRP